MAINPQDHKPEHPTPPSKKSPLPLLALLLLVAGGAAGATWYFLTNIQTRQPAPLSATTAGKTEIQDSVKPPSAMQTEGEDLPIEQLATDEEVLPPTAPPEKINPQQQCKQLAGKLLTFFNHLDTEPYIQEFKLNQPVLQHFNLLTAKLLANPPVVTRESDDLYTILTNMAHFFRIIGRQNILLMKSILDRERDKIEDVAAELYEWNLVNRCAEETFQMQAPLDQVYEYAGFFLNTMGGRSYLFRRDSRSRLLVNYYAILIVDQANKANMNRYGLDISGIIPQLIREIEATNQLIYKEDYIDSLLELQEKYPN